MKKKIVVSFIIEDDLIEEYEIPIKSKTTVADIIEEVKKFLLETNG